MLQLLMLAKQDKASPTMETTALIHKVTQSFSNIMDEKLLKFSMTLEKNFHNFREPVQTHHCHGAVSLGYGGHGGQPV